MLNKLKENWKSIVITLLILIGGYYGYDIIVTPKVTTPDIEVNNKFPTDSTAVDTIK